MKSDHLRCALLVSCFFVACTTGKSPVELGSTRQADTAAPAEYSVFRRLNPTPSPEPRDQMSLVFDPARGVTLLFGGHIQTGTTPPADTWAYDGAWSKVCEGSSCANPGNRSSAGFAFAPGRGVAVLFGGYDGDKACCDTWEWNGATATWTEKSSPVCADTGLTASREGHGMADVGDGVALFGGNVGNSVPHLTNDLYVWDGTAWSVLCDSACETRSGKLPVPRYGATLVHVPIGGNMLLLFGGMNGTAYLNDTWEFDLVTYTWSERCTSGTCKSTLPPARGRHGAAFDSNRNRMFVHGGCNIDAFGYDCSSPLRDAFEYDPTADAWTALPSLDPNFPDGKSDFGIAFDSTRARIVEFGGGTAGPSPYLDDTVEYYTRGGACRTAADCDTKICEKKSASDATGICVEPCTAGDAGGARGPCVNGFLCNTLCDTPCHTCAAVPGVCTAITGGVDDEAGDAPGSHCSGDHTCSAAGACTLAVGQVCNNDTQCASGNCAKYGSHVCAEVGCGDVPCLRAAANGACAAADFPPECGGSGCTTDGQCIQACTDDHQCAAEFFCDTEGTHRCKSGIRLGDPCKDSQECGKGSCYDGVCCENPCFLSCEVCGAGGKCVPIPAAEAPHTGHPACLGSGVCGGSCDGVDHSCFYPTDVTPCGAGTCFESDWRVGQVCDSHGACVQTPEAKSCGAFSCDQGACHTECSTDEDCSRTAKCDLSSGVGVCNEKGATCVNDNSSVKTTSGSIVSCGGYPCVGNVCMFRPCASDSDCTAGYACTSDHRCVEAPDPTGKERADAGATAEGGIPGGGIVAKGASCSMGSGAHERSRSAPLFALTALMALALRRIADRTARHREPPRETS